MNRKLILLPVIALVAFTSKAQEKKNLTIHDAILGRQFYPTSLSQLQWADDNHYSYMPENQENPGILLVELERTKNGTSKFISLHDINSAMAAGESDTLKRFPYHSWMNSYELRFNSGNKSYAYHIGDKKVRELVLTEDSWIASSEHPKTMDNAFVMGDNLYIRKGSKDIKITTDGGNGIVYGQSVHRNEFGIDGGLFWSGAGDKLAFYRMDESMVTDYPIYDLSQKPAGVKNIKYPVAGDPSHHVTIGVYSISSGKTIYLKTGEPKEQYLTNVAWGPDDKYIYVAVVNRGQNHMWLKKFDATTGAFIKTLFEETNSRYVEPEHPVQFLKTKKDQFIWWSERDGNNHLYLYDTSGKMIKQLTSGKWEVMSFLGFNSKEDKFYITSTANGPLNRDLYCFNLKNGKSQRLTTGDGTHRISPSTNLSFFIDYFSNVTTPLNTQIIKEDGTLFQVLKEAENPLQDYRTGEVSLGSIKADDGTELFYRLVKPANFDPTKKYPVVVYLYGGPHLQLITNSWMGGANNWYQYMAEQGVIMFSIDNRGSSNRGFEFESAVHRQLGTLEMSDQMAGVNWLKKQSFVDTSRMGIHGWSFGGFMTTSMMTRNPGVFKVGVAGGPVINWEYYEIMYTERYMDTPEENPEGYKNNNLLNYVDKLQGHLLMIHGAEDDVVLWQHSLMFLQKAEELDVTGLDYFVYPAHKHNVLGKDRAHLYEKVTNYLMLYLKE